MTQNQSKEELFVEALAKKHAAALERFLTTEEDLMTRFWCYLLKNGEIVWTIDEGLVSTEPDGKLFHGPSERTDFGVTPKESDIVSGEGGHYIFHNPSQITEYFARDDENRLIRITIDGQEGPRVSLEELLESKKRDEEDGWFHFDVYGRMVLMLQDLRGESDELKATLKRLNAYISDFICSQYEDSD